MTIEEFADDVEGFWAPHLDRERLKASYALGLCGESAELHISSGNKHEQFLELGDCIHYTVGLMRLYELPHPYFSYVGDYSPSTVGLMEQTCAVGDMVKKNIFHGKPAELPFKREIHGKLNDVMAVLKAYADACHIDIGEAMEANIEKLKSRHSGTTFKKEVYAEAR